MVALSFLMVWLLGSAALAQPQPDSNCRDDRGVDRCAQEQQRLQRQLYDVQPIEQHSARAEQVRRIFYVDGYGRDLALISFARAPGKDIELEVRTPSEEGVRRPPLTAGVPLAVWEEVIADSRHFDRKLAPQPDDNRIICMHSWIYTAEATDPPRQSRDAASVRQAVENACDDGLVQAFAHRLAKHALDLLPPCRTIDPAGHRNSVAILAACSRLSGDRIAAAGAMNALHKMDLGNQRELTPELRAGFGHRVRFDIDGQVTEHEWQAAAPFWLQQRQALGANFYPESFHGERWDHVVVRGRLSRTGEGGERPQSAAMEMVFGWEPSQTFKVQQIKVGAFASASATRRTSSSGKQTGNMSERLVSPRAR